MTSYITSFCPSDSKIDVNDIVIVIFKNDESMCFNVNDIKNIDFLKEYEEEIIENVKKGQFFYRINDEKLSAFSLKDFDNKNNYEFIKFLGAGQYGSVYLAKNKKTGVIGALKVLKSKSDNEFIIGNILPYNDFVVKYYSLFSDGDNTYYIFMEYLEGSELKEAYTNFGENEIKIAIIDLIISLSYIHSYGVMHRDIKAENVITTKDKNVLIDFGMSEISYTKKRCGTPRYLSPELVRNDVADYKSDIWALGILIFYLIYRKFPHNVDNFKQLAVAILLQKINFPEEEKYEFCNDFILNFIKFKPQDRISLSDALKHPFLKEIAGSIVIPKTVHPRIVYYK